MKKILSTCVMFACTLGLTFSALAGCGTEPAPEPIYTSNEKFQVGMWVGIDDVHVEYNVWGEELSRRSLTTEEFEALYLDVAEAGITVAYPGYTKMVWADEVYNKKALKAAHKAGIKQILCISTIREYLTTAHTLYQAGAVTKSEVVEQVRAYLKPYLEYEEDGVCYGDALYGVMMKDEPSAALFDMLGFGQEIFAEAAPDLIFYTNLFPVIANGSQLGGGTSISYDTYVAQYLHKIKTPYVSYDHYPLYEGRDTYIESSFLQNMEIIRKAIDDEGEDREMWTFLQSISYGAKNRALRSVGDATFQMYSFLAYGGDCVQWFCYSCPPPNDGATSFGNDALLNRDLEKTDAYDYVKTANAYVQALMPWYKNFTWKGVMTSSEDGGEGNFENIEKMSGTKTLSKVEGTNDVLVGVFSDKDGRDGYMVVNFTDPGKELSNTVTLSVSSVHNAIVVLNGQKTIVPVKNGKITINLNSGEGCFVIPY